ncbi:hypothetical protein C8Q76DRAFT_790532 [Earliella scabrosa]|nr:hypothetical protein C8Q76DRAFT_790532 [Earliella scabrosa]
MANWFDYVSLVLTLSVFAGLAYVFLYAKKAVTGAVASTKDSLKSKGVDVSAHGLSVKTDKRFDREQYLDATQRSVRVYIDLFPQRIQAAASDAVLFCGFIKAFNASSAGNNAHAEAPPLEKRSSLGGRKWRRSETE